MAIEKSNKLATVDVIIPTYNGLPYLKEAVDSVLAQTHKNFTLYVIDDGSTDNGATKKFINSIKDRRIKYYKKKNGGQATARNYGMKISKAPFITFIDSDDIWLPKKLKKQIACFKKNPSIDMVYGYHYIIDQHEKVVGKVTHSREGNLYNYLLGGNRISGSASMVMIKRSVIDDVGLFREDFLIGEDWEMWLRIAHKYQIGCIHEYLAKLRALPEGMQKNYLKMARGLDYMLPILIKEFKPGWFGKAKLYGSSLWDATNYYYMGGDYDRAQKAFLRLLIHNPFKLKLSRVYWPMYIRLSMRSRYIRALRRTLSPGYRYRERQYQKEQRAKLNR